MWSLEESVIEFNWRKFVVELCCESDNKQLFCFNFSSWSKCWLCNSCKIITQITINIRFYVFCQTLKWSSAVSLAQVPECLGCPGWTSRAGGEGDGDPLAVRWRSLSGASLQGRLVDHGVGGRHAAVWRGRTPPLLSGETETRLFKTMHMWRYPLILFFSYLL